MESKLKPEKSEKERMIKQRKWNEYKTVTNMVDSNPAISVITLNVNGLNIPIKGPIKIHYQVEF